MPDRPATIVGGAWYDTLEASRAVTMRYFVAWTCSGGVRRYVTAPTQWVGRPLDDLDTVAFRTRLELDMRRFPPV